MREVARAIHFVLKAILQLKLRMRGETIAGGDVRAPEVVSPRRGPAIAVRDVAEELLVPARGGEKLRREFVFRLEVISERVGIGESGNFEARLEEFRPQLQVMPGKTDVLPEQTFVVIADVATE